MPRKGGVPENLIKGKATQFNGETAAIAGAKSARAKSAKKTVADYLQKWAEGEVSEKNKNALRALGLTEEVTNRALLVIPLIKKANSGDTKALQMIFEMLGEDKAKERQIKKLEAEIELLRAEAQKIKAQMGEDREVEDLSALGDLLKGGEEGNENKSND